MDARVKTTLPDTIAADLGIIAGDCVLAVNDNTQLEDMFDYEFEVLYDSEITLLVKHLDGSEELYEIEKDSGEDLGIVFESPIFTPIKTCNNACPFCFIDQQPEGLRPTLYIKDDDYRLSYFCNTYITLTNLTRHDRDRIERIRPGPLYVSVHSTVPEVREKLLVNKKAGEVMKELTWLASLEVPFHAQLVICPGINDGESLSQSLKDLSTLHPHCLSVAVVPVGLTNFRGSLPDLTAMTKSVALDVIERLGRFAVESGLPEFAFASDEFYVRAEMPMPGYEAYGEFPQLDDGVGTARLLVQEFFELEAKLPEKIEPEQRHVVLTGQLGGMILQPIVQRLNAIDGLYLDLVAVHNKFWGEAVTVAGLITGKDILNTLSGQDLSGYESIFLPETMLKSGDTLFLDGLSVEDLEDKLDCAIDVVKQPSRALSLLSALFPDRFSPPPPEPFVPVITESAY
jgi:putative radical SAM enzyme (TIGR03279 family)